MRIVEITVIKPLTPDQQRLRNLKRTADIARNRVKAEKAAQRKRKALAQLAPAKKVIGKKATPKRPY